MSHVMKVIQQLHEKRIFRPLDEQFARFIEQQGGHESLVLLAAILSAELGKGNSCLNVYDEKDVANDLSRVLGVSSELSELIKPFHFTQNFRELFAQSTLVSLTGDDPLPFVFDGQRLFLNRYWHYELTVATKLSGLSQPVSMPPKATRLLRDTLNQLFYRQYSFLWQALQALPNDANNEDRKTVVSDYLNIVDYGPSQSPLDWDAIVSVVSTAAHVEDLKALDTLVPLQYTIDWQKIAAAVAVTRRFAVISGGPGTGKTTTVTKLLVALITQYQQLGISPIIKMVAPTGKAAARMTEQMGKAVQALALSQEITHAIPQEASTLHRLLGAKRNSAEFKHNARNPLHLDVLVVDEASMVDLPMMYKLLTALPPSARLILLGDKDQLASVDAGAVLGDICSFHHQGYSAEQRESLTNLTGFNVTSELSETLATPSPVADSLCMLRKSYRFHAESGIGFLARGVNQGDSRAVERTWQRGFTDISHHSLNESQYQELIKLMVRSYQGYLSAIHQQATTPSDLSLATSALKQFGSSRLLCAVREGDFGVTGLNQRIQAALNHAQLIQHKDELWYHGRPIMITKNDPNLGLFNGDIGICITETDETNQSSRLKVYFELPDGSTRGVLPSRVPQHETAYAMTIHKSQGSEFAHTVMVLPPEYTPILTRELVYTGITRAAQQFTLFANTPILNKAIHTTTERASGLVSKLKN